MIACDAIDEYLTGEQDKITKTIWRFPSAGKMIQEDHDLAFGETVTKVVEIAFLKPS